MLNTGEQRDIKDRRDTAGEKGARAAAGSRSKRGAECRLRGQEALFQTGLQLSSETLEK